MATVESSHVSVRARMLREDREGDRARRSPSFPLMLRVFWHTMVMLWVLPLARSSSR